MSQHEQYENVEMYVLGGLSEEEQQEFEDHLQNCSECQHAVHELQEVVGLLPLTSEPVEPPSGMKDRVLSHALGEEYQAQVDEKKDEPAPSPSVKRPVRWRRWSGLGIAGLSAATVILGLFSFQQQGEINELQQELATTEEQLGQAQEELDEAILSLDDPMQFSGSVELSPATEGSVADGLAMMVVDSDATHLMVLADDMPELEGDEAFQVWLMRDEQPVNAGTFHTDNGQGALHYTFEQSGYDTVAITHEPDAEGAEPRGEMVLAAELPNEY